ncbi:MAG TPA: hypothetical protein VMH04_08140 [Candidatus Solibacter sp.]|nr:hypothetical protein [Candidatus Solibacter sp.]
MTIISAPSMLPKYSVVDNDLWLHLKVGDWILEHHTVPHTGILSRTAGDRPWIAYSWIYEVLLSVFHLRLHLIGISIYGLLLTLAVSYCVFWMARRLSRTFWAACFLATATCAAFLFRVYPRPVFFSMALFTITLTLLLEARRAARLHPLYWLPAIFVLWVNVHIQFVYGVFAVALFVGVSTLQEQMGRTRFTASLVPPALPWRKLLLILAACVGATCIGPYTFHPYAVVFAYASSTFPFAHVREFQALDFRGYTDFVQLLMTGFAFFALGRKKQFDVFLFLLLVVAAVIGFRAQRDSWFICIPAAACLASEVAEKKIQQARERERGHEEKDDRDEYPEPESVWERLSVAAVLAGLLGLYANLVDFNTLNLRLAINAVYPVQAVNFLRDHPQPGPLYNTYDWGDFITWYMPEYPVSIDGRTDLYGDELDNRFYLTENGDPLYADDPYLQESKLVLIGKQKPLARLLSSDEHFQLIYEDSQAAVYMRR